MAQHARDDLLLRDAHGASVLDLEGTVGCRSSGHAASLEGRCRGRPVTAPAPHGGKFGHDFGVQTEAGKASDPSNPGSVSWSGIYYTYFWIDPKEERVGILTTQLFPADGIKLREDFKTPVYKGLQTKT